MKKKTKYANASKDIASSIVQSEKIDDFLPEPKDLMDKEDTLKVTLNLSKSSVDFFKQQAELLGYPYQRMIKQVIDIYTKHYRKKHLQK